MKKLFRFSTIQTRLIISFLTLLFIPMLATGILTYKNSSEAIQEKISQNSIETMEQVVKNIQMEMEKFKTYSDQIIFSQEIQALSNYDPSQFQDQSNLNYDIQTKVIFPRLGSLQAVQDVSIKTDKVVIRWGAPLEDQKVKFFDKISEISKTKSGDISWFVSNYNGIPNNIVMNRAIKNMNTGSIIGYFTMSLNEKFLSEIMTMKKAGIYENVFAVNSQGIIVYDKDLNKVGQPFFDQELIKKIKGYKNLQKLNYKLGDTNYVITYSSLKNADWYAVSTIPVSALNADSKKIRNYTIIISSLCLLLAVFLSMLIAFSISVPLKQIVQLMKAASEGNLTIKIYDNHSDEISFVANNFADMIDHMKCLVSKVKFSSSDVIKSAEKIYDSAEKTYEESEQISFTIQNVANGSTEQAEQTYKSLLYMNVLATGINDVENNIKTVSEVVKGTQKQSEDALLTVKELSVKAQESNQVSEKIYKEINSLVTEIREIEKIIKLISDIAGQTTLLSLNAAIEAARAKNNGFAVVAEEVKKLATKSQNASTNIKNIITNILNKTETTTALARSGSVIMSKQMNAVNSTEKAFKTIYEAMGNMHRYVNTTLESSKEMLKAKDQTLESIEYISSVTEEAASTSQQVAALTQEQMARAEVLKNFSKELNEMAQSLEKAIDLFKIDD